MTYEELEKAFHKMYPCIPTVDYRPYDPIFINKMKERPGLCFCVNFHKDKKVSKDDDLLVWFPSQYTLDNQNSFTVDDKLTKHITYSIKEKLMQRMLSGESPEHILTDFILNG